MAKYLGIDYGTKKIGIALSDTEGRVAFAHDIILSDAFAPSVVADLAHKEGVDEIVVGESINMQGGLNKVAEDAAKFVEEIKKFTDIKIYFEDERLTTRQARQLPMEGEPRGEIANKGRASGVQKPMVDKHAAAIILQSYLDKQDN